MAVDLSRNELRDKQQRNTERAIQNDAFQEGLDSALSFVSASNVSSTVIDDFEREAVADGVGDEFVESFEEAITE